MQDSGRARARAPSSAPRSGPSALIPLADNLPPGRATPVTWTLVAVNAVVFAALVGLPLDVVEDLFRELGVVPARFHPDWPAHRLPRGPFGLAALPLLTSQFLHAGWLHVIANMWTLAIFGRGVERRMGPARFLTFYLLVGALSGAAHAWFNPRSLIPAVGASGAIAGVMGAYLALYPRARLVMLFPFLIPFFLPISAVFYFAYWFFLQLYSGTLALANPQAAAGVAWWAHIGGFVAGLLLVTLFTPPRRRRRVVYEVWDPKLRRWRSMRL